MCKITQQFTDQKYTQKSMVPYTYKHIKVYFLTFCKVSTVFRTDYCTDYLGVPNYNTVRTKKFFSNPHTTHMTPTC